MEKKKSETVEVEVLRAVGLPADTATIEKAKQRAELRGLTFKADGLTMMAYPGKDKPNFIKIDKDIARKLNQAGAVRVVI